MPSQSFSSSDVLLLGVVLAIGWRAWWAARAGRIQHAAVSVIAASMYLVALYLPARLQAAGLLASKLEAAEFLMRPGATELSSLSLRWSAELTIIALSEVLVIWLAGKRATRTRQPWGEAKAKRVALVLVIIGALSYVLVPSVGLDQRAADGQGVGVLLRSCLVSGLVIAIWYRHFLSHWWLALTVVSAAWLAIGAVRSPLVFLAFALIMRELTGRVAKPARLALVLVVVALAASAMSTFRAETTRGSGIETGELASSILGNPVFSVLESGVDTLDGYRFADAISPMEPARPADLTRAVTTFVPRALWPDKSYTISVIVTQKYLGWGASGIFLSPVGYLTLVAGSYLGGLALLSVLVMAISSAWRKAGSTFWLAYVAYAVFRIFLNGSSFDVYYVLVYAVPVVLVSAFVRDAKGAPPLPTNVPLAKCDHSVNRPPEAPIVA